MGDKTRGVYHKFHVSRTDGKSAPGKKHEGCDYFVLDVNHDPFAKAALLAYAQACETEYPLLAYDCRAMAALGVMRPHDARSSEAAASVVAEAGIELVIPPIGDGASTLTGIERSCTCPPAERPVNCMRKYALTECWKATTCSERRANGYCSCGDHKIGAGMVWPITVHGVRHYPGECVTLDVTAQAAAPARPSPL